MMVFKLMKTFEGIEVLLNVPAAVDGPGESELNQYPYPIANPDPSRIPALKSVQYGWLMYPSQYLNGVLLTAVDSIAPGVGKIGFESYVRRRGLETFNCSDGFEVDTLEELIEILERRYKHTLNQQVVSPTSVNYIGRFWDFLSNARTLNDSILSKRFGQRDALFFFRSTIKGTIEVLSDQLTSEIAVWVKNAGEIPKRAFMSDSDKKIVKARIMRDFEENSLSKLLCEVVDAWNV